jgi:hypothetical protein
MIQSDLLNDGTWQKHQISFESRKSLIKKYSALPLILVVKLYVKLHVVFADKLINYSSEWPQEYALQLLSEHLSRKIISMPENSRNPYI